MYQLTLEDHAPDEIPDRTFPSYKGKNGPRVLKTCKVCGGPFLIAAGLADKYTTCSTECKREAYRKPFPEEKVCVECGETKPASEFYLVGKSQRPAPRCKGCTSIDGKRRIAALQAKRAALPPGEIPDRTHPSWPGEKRIQQVCTVCDGPYLIAPGQAQNVQTCSRECASKRRGRDRKFVSPDVTEKRCSRCRTVKPREEFAVLATKKGRLHLAGWCNDCNTPANRDQQQAKLDLNRSFSRRLTLGLTQEEWAVLLPTLRKDCAVCGTTEKLCADHDHATGRFRDILCNQHNAALGMAGDDPAMLRKLADYLESHAAAAMEVAKPAS